MKTAKQDVVPFHFQIIPLKDAVTMSIAGSGLYSELKMKLLNTLPTLKEDQAFSFGLPKGEVSHLDRKRILAALNKCLNDTHLPHHIVYSDSQRLFVCVPNDKLHGNNGNLPQSRGYVPHSPYNSFDDTAIENLRNQGLSIPEISKKLGIPWRHVKYVVYQKGKKRRKPVPTSKPTSKEDFPDVDSIVKHASKLFNVNENLIRTGKYEGRVIRNAIVHLLKEKKMPNQKIAPHFGISMGGVQWILAKPTGHTKIPLDKLRNSLEGKS